MTSEQKQQMTAAITALTVTITAVAFLAANAAFGAPTRTKHKHHARHANTARKAVAIRITGSRTAADSFGRQQYADLAAKQRAVSIATPSADDSSRIVAAKVTN